MSDFNTNVQVLGLICNIVMAVGAIVAAFLAYKAYSASLQAIREQTVSSDEDHVHRLTDRLYEFDHMMLDHPDIERFVDDYAGLGKYFTSNRSRDEQFYRVKAYILFQINFFDEIFCLMADDATLQQRFEFDSWKVYISKRMQNPLFRELFWSENIWGERFTRFCEGQGILPVA